MSSVYRGLLASFAFTLCVVRVAYADGEVHPQVQCRVPVAQEGRPVNFTVDLPAMVTQDDNYNFNVRFNQVVVPVVSCDVGRTKRSKRDNPCTVDEGYAISGIRHQQLVFTVLDPEKKDAGDYTFTLQFYDPGHDPYSATCGLEVHAGNCPCPDYSGHKTNQAIIDTTADPGKTCDDSTSSVAIAVPVTVVVTIILVLLVQSCLWKSERFQKFLQRRQLFQVPNGDAQGNNAPTPQTVKNGSPNNASALPSRRTAHGQGFGEKEDYKKKTASQLGAQALLAGNEHQGEKKDADENFEILTLAEQNGECGDPEMKTMADSSGWCSMQ